MMIIYHGNVLIVVLVVFVIRRVFTVRCIAFRESADSDGRLYKLDRPLVLRWCPKKPVFAIQELSNSVKLDAGVLVDVLVLAHIIFDLAGSDFFLDIPIWESALGEAMSVSNVPLERVRPSLMYATV